MFVPFGLAILLAFFLGTHLDYFKVPAPASFSSGVVEVFVRTTNSRKVGFM